MTPLVTIIEEDGLTAEAENMQQENEPFDLDDDDLDRLWSLVKDLKPHECLHVRCITQIADGVMARIKQDARFEDFNTSKASYRKSFQVDDLRSFRICRGRPSKFSARRKSAR